MRVAVGQFFHETNTFLARRTALHDFVRYDYSKGSELVARYGGTLHYLGGMLSALERTGATIVPLLSASTTPSGLIARDAYETILTETIQRLHAQGLLDAVCLALHGASAVEGIDDPEGHFLAAVREHVGQTVPIVATLDLHANVTRAMVRWADGLFGANLYPHTDQFERGEEAVAFLKEVMEGTLTPVMAVTRLGMLVPSSKEFSHADPALSLNRLAWGYESAPRVRDCTIFWGYPYADLPETGMSVVVITNGEPALAGAIGHKMCEHIWERRHLLMFDDPTPEEAVHLALVEPKGPVVIAETSDNPGGGSAGDGTSLLGALLEAKAGRRVPTCYAFIADPEVVLQAHAAGVGSRVDILLGGKTDDLHGPPLAVSALVRVLSDGRFRLVGAMGRGMPFDLGRMVRLEIDGIDVLVAERREQVFDDAVLRLHGIDPREYHIVALKSSMHFRAAFDPIARRILYASGAGLTTSDYRKFSYRRLLRPTWPLDNVVEMPLRGEVD